MPAIATSKFRIHNAEQFKEAFSETDDTKMYFYIGGISSFVDDTNPPTPTNNTSSIEYSPWSDMIGAKRVIESDVVQVIERYNWTVGTVYDQYDDQDSDILDDDFYVMTENYNVYKCLWNNNGVAAGSVTGTSDQPTGTSTTPFQTTDGYIWKYMYTVTTADALKFLTNEFIPVRTDSTVNAYATSTSNGAIHAIVVTAGGSGYVATGPTPDIPVVTITGTGGTTVVDPAGVTVDGSGAVTQILVQGYQLGTGYSSATVTIAPPAGGGDTATARAIISPKGGHGFNAEEELGGKYVMLNVRLDGTEGNTISIENDFRKVGLVRDPYNYGTTTVADTTNIRQTFKHTFSTAPTGTFLPDDVVTVGDSSAVVVEFDAADGAHGALYTTLPSPDPSDFDGSGSQKSITSTSGGGANIDSLFDAPGLEPHSGDVLYIENRSPISRASDQIEDVKLIIEF
jgi:hypothetical protein